MTAFRLIDTNDVFVKETLKEMDQFSQQNRHLVKFKPAVEVNMFSNLVLLLQKKYFIEPSDSSLKFIFLSIDASFFDL